MRAITKAVYVLTLMLAGWLRRVQAAEIEFLHTSIRLFLSRFDGRIILTDDERANIAVLGMAMTREHLKENSSPQRRYCDGPEGS